MFFRDRSQAGQMLAGKLSAYANRPDVLVLALPRGGVPVAYEVARALNAPLDVFLVRKLGVPGHAELAMGAIASGGVRIVNDDVVEYLRIPDSVIDSVATEELQELQRREHAYRGTRPLPRIGGRTIILVDDGLATGASMRAAVTALRKEQPTRIIVAVPVVPASVQPEFKGQADEMTCILTPEPFGAVGSWYQNFVQVTDEEVRALLERAQLEHSATLH